MLEIACFSANSAIAAAKFGADRVELCADYDAGGITPPVEWLSAIRTVTNIPVNVMIRPRGGDFNYTNTEFHQMQAEIATFKSLADGFVFGILNNCKEVDTTRTSQLVQLAAPLPCTFHRAIDETSNLHEAVEDVIECGCTSILTSGGVASAAQGTNKIANLQSDFGQRITLIVGGGVRRTNLKELKDITQVPWFHSAAIMKAGEEVDSEEVVSLKAIITANS